MTPGFCFRNAGRHSAELIEPPPPPQGTLPNSWRRRVEDFPDFPRFRGEGRTLFFVHKDLSHEGMHPSFCLQGHSHSGIEGLRGVSSFELELGVLVSNVQADGSDGLRTFPAPRHHGERRRSAHQGSKRTCKSSGGVTTFAQLSLHRGSIHAFSARETGLWFARPPPWSRPDDMAHEHACHARARFRVF